MNYLIEIKLFYDWLETYPLPPAAIALWHALMFTANRSGWAEQFAAPNALLMLRTGSSRSTIYRERCRLREAGRIAYRPQGGSADSIYEIHALEERVASNRDAEYGIASRLASRPETQNPAGPESVSRGASQWGTRLYKRYRVSTEKEKTSKKEKAAEERKERKSCAKKRETPHLNQARFLSTLDAPWREVMAAWLEYKRMRHESYRSELGATKCLTLLRNLSGDSAAVAAAIIDQSIANNWAGLFPLRTGSAAVSVRSQHPGQIIHPASDERTRHLLEKFDRK